MNLLPALLAALAQPGGAPDPAPVVEVVWEELAKEEPLRTGELLPGLPGGALRIETTDNGPHNILVWQIDDPPLKSKRWRLEGRVRYLGIEGEGQLVLMSTLEGREYFTKTVAPSGPLGRLSGHSDWRPFVLPFDALDKKVPPKRIKLQVFLPGKGSVDLSSMRLYEGFDDALVADLGPRLGWNDATFGIAAGLFGSFLGFMGAFIGFLGVSRKDVSLIRTVRRIAIGLSATVALVGIAAILSGGAGGWLISVGAIGVLLFSALDRVIRKSVGAS